MLYVYILISLDSTVTESYNRVGNLGAMYDSSFNRTQQVNTFVKKSYWKINQIGQTRKCPRNTKPDWLPTP